MGMVSEMVKPIDLFSPQSLRSQEAALSDSEDKDDMDITEGGGIVVSDSLPQGSSYPHQISSTTVFSSPVHARTGTNVTCYLNKCSYSAMFYIFIHTYVYVLHILCIHMSNCQSILSLSLRYNTDFDSWFSSSLHDKNCCHPLPSLPLFPFLTAPLFSEIKPDDFPVKAKRGKKKKKSAETPERKKPKLDELKVFFNFFNCVSLSFLPLGHVAYVEYSRPVKFWSALQITLTCELDPVRWLFLLGLPKGARGGIWQLRGLAPRLQPVPREEWRRWGPEYGRWGQTHREVQSKGQASNSATAIMCLTTRCTVIS